MKKLLGFAIMSIFLLSSTLVSAQNGNNSLVVSKGVQDVANKKAFEDENSKKSHIQAKSVEFPAIVISKGIVQPTGQPAEGNITSEGYPTWAISKGTARHNMELHQKKADSNEYPSEGVIQDSREISKK
jgi:hypothetical protein